MFFIEANPKQIELDFENGQPTPKDWKKTFGKLISNALNLNESFDYSAPNKRYEGEFGAESDKPELKKIFITFDYNGHTPEKSALFIEVVDAIISVVKSLYGRDAASWNQVKVIIMKWAGTYSECELFRFCKLELVRRNMVDYVNKGLPEITNKPDIHAWAENAAEIIKTNGITLNLIIHVGNFRGEMVEDESHKEQYEHIIKTKKKAVWIMT